MHEERIHTGDEAQAAALEASEASLRQAQAELAGLRTHLKKFRFRLVDNLYRALSKLWPLLPTLRFLLWSVVWWWLSRGPLRSRRAMHRWVDRLLFVEPASYWMFGNALRSLVQGQVLHELGGTLGTGAAGDARAWFRAYRPNAKLLRLFGGGAGPHAPVIAVILKPRAVPDAWRCDSLKSVLAQVYPHWQGLGEAPAAVLARCGDPRLQLTARSEAANSEEAILPSLASCSADYVCWLDEGDVLEPHALHRLAETVLDHQPDILYSDEVVVGADLKTVLGIQARPQFSHDLYLAHAYIGHLTAVRTKLLAAADTPRDPLDWQNQDALLLRLLERAGLVAHVPDLLYRHRPGTELSAAEQFDAQAFDAQRPRRIREHLQRLGLRADVAPTDHPACLDIRFELATPPRIAIVIPTKNKVELLRACIASLERTVPSSLASIHIVDHASDDPPCQAYLAEQSQVHDVLGYEGEFNFSRINNHAVHQLGPGFTHYLFLNNDIEALEPGWLEHMAGLAQRPDVGIVGAMLLFPDRTVQHAGVMVGMHLAADHPERQAPFFGPDGRRLAGRDLSFLATRELSAVTGACLLIRAEAFGALGGFDPRLAVGFGDIDLCLRARARGYKVVLDAHAVLLHHESATRPRTARDPHPLDTQMFRTRHLQAILGGDPFFSPLYSRECLGSLNAAAHCREHVLARVTAAAPAEPVRAAQVHASRRARAA